MDSSKRVSVCDKVGILLYGLGHRMTLGESNSFLISSTKSMNHKEDLGAESPH